MTLNYDKYVFINYTGWNFENAVQKIRTEIKMYIRMPKLKIRCKYKYIIHTITFGHYIWCISDIIGLMHISFNLKKINYYK